LVDARWFRGFKDDKGFQEFSYAMAGGLKIFLLVKDASRL